MSMQFRFAKADEYPAISEFLDTHWAKGHIYTRDEELFRWTFRRTNHWDDDGYSFALAEDNGELVGILGGIPFVLNAFGQKSKAVWIVNYVIRPDHRKGTGALQLLSMFRKAPFEATVAAGITKESTVIYRVLRGQVLDPIPRHFMVLPNGGERFVAIVEHRSSGLAGGACGGAQVGAGAQDDSDDTGRIVCRASARLGPETLAQLRRENGGRGTRLGLFVLALSTPSAFRLSIYQCRGRAAGRSCWCGDWKQSGGVRTTDWKMLTASDGWSSFCRLPNKTRAIW